MIEPFYFGKAPKLLFGIYHPPPPTSQRNGGLVLCYPIGQEYIRSHRAIAQLAAHLAATGFHVLRFDYYGCGDSYGSFVEGSIDQWCHDILTAVDELKHGTGVSRIGLVGLRLGASLAVMTSPDIECHATVLWEPIVSGSMYLKELIDHHKSWLSGSFAKMDTSGIAREALGFELSDLLRQQLETLCLAGMSDLRPGRTLIIDNTLTPASQHLCQRLLKQNIVSNHMYIASPSVWIKSHSDDSKGLVPLKTIEGVTNWAVEAFS